MSDEDKAITINYRNHRGEYGERKIYPLRVWFGTSAYHPGSQWFLHCRVFDYEKYDKGVARDFALADIGLTEPAKDWRCFHCDEVFSTERAARLHFGDCECQEPACKIKAGAEMSMLEALRRAEEEARKAVIAMHDESSEGWIAFRRLEARTRENAEAAENLGYERGLRDGRMDNGEVDKLREALRLVKDAIIETPDGVVADVFWMQGEITKGATVVDFIDMTLSPPSAEKVAPMENHERQSAWSALRMISDALSESFAPKLISIESEEASLLRGPEYHHFAEGVVEAIRKMAQNPYIKLIMSAQWNVGDRVEKKSGAQWRGEIVGLYSTALTSVGYAIESSYEMHSVQVFPEQALRHTPVRPLTYEGLKKSVDGLSGKATIDDLKDMPEGSVIVGASADVVIIDDVGSGE